MPGSFNHHPSQFLRIVILYLQHDKSKQSDRSSTVFRQTSTQTSSYNLVVAQVQPQGCAVL